MLKVIQLIYDVIEARPELGVCFIANLLDY